MRAMALPLLLMVSLVSGCDDPSDADSPPRYDLVLEPSTLNLVGPGDTARISARVTRPVTGRPAELTWTSRDVAIARVTQSGVVFATANGTTWITVRDVLGKRDSVKVDVRQVAVGLTMFVRDTLGTPGARRRIFAGAVDARGNGVALPAGTVVWSTRRGLQPVSVVAVACESEATFQPASAGRDTVVATLGSFTVQRELVVAAPPRLLANLDTLFTAVGAMALFPPIITASTIIGDAPNPRFAFANLAIAGPSERGVAVPEGRQVGTTTLEVTSPGYQSLSIPVVVTPLRMSKSHDPRPLGSRFFGAEFTPSHTRGERVIMTRPIDFSVESSDSTVLLLRSSRTGTLPVGGQGFSYFGVTGNPGAKAFVVTRIEGFPPDTSRFELASGSAQLFNVSGSLTTLPSLVAGLPERALVSPDRYPVGPGEIRFESKRGLIEVAPVPYQVSDLQTRMPVTIFPRRAGVDTLVMTGPGLRGDTLVVWVAPVAVTLTADAPVFLGTESRLYLFPPGTGTPAPEPDRIPMRLRSTNPAVLRVWPETVVVTSRSFVVPDARVRGLAIGEAEVIATPLIADVAAAPLRLAVGANRIRSIVGPQVVGHGQSTRIDFRWAYAPSADSVFLRSTDTSVARPARSVSLASRFENEVRVLGGRRAGTAWIVASAPDVPADSVRIDVRRPRLSLVARREPTPDSAARWPWKILVNTLSPEGRPTVTDDAVTLAIRVSDTTRATVEPRTLTIGAGSFQSAEFTLRFIRRPPEVVKDTIFVEISDPRGASGGYESVVGELVWDNLLSSSTRVAPRKDVEVSPTAPRRRPPSR